METSNPLTKQEFEKSLCNHIWKVRYEFVSPIRISENEVQEKTLVSLVCATCGEFKTEVKC